MNDNSTSMTDDSSSELIALIKDAEAYVQPSCGFRADTIHLSKCQTEKQNGSWRLSAGSAVLTLSMVGLLLLQHAWEWGADQQKTIEQFQNRVQRAPNDAHDRDWDLAEAVQMRPGWPLVPSPSVARGPALKRTVTTADGRVGQSIWNGPNDFDSP
ncbi:MAG: hypothetical protein AAGD07_02205 [Planctomycetota bacterium]